MAGISNTQKNAAGLGNRAKIKRSTRRVNERAVQMTLEVENKYAQGHRYLFVFVLRVRWGIYQRGVDSSKNNKQRFSYTKTDCDRRSVGVRLQNETVISAFGVLLI